MAKMVVIYKKPADPEAFNRHYFDIHAPLAKKLPGLRRYDVSRGDVVNLAAGEAPYLVGTLHFDAMADMKAASATEAGRACAEDRRKYAPDETSFTMLLFDDEPV